MPSNRNNIRAALSHVEVALAHLKEADEAAAHALSEQEYAREAYDHACAVYAEEIRIGYQPKAPRARKRAA